MVLYFGDNTEPHVRPLGVSAPVSCYLRAAHAIGQHDEVLHVQVDNVDDPAFIDTEVGHL